MRVAILHHHFNRGGVTQVVANHLRALAATADTRSPPQIALLYGGRHDGAPSELLDGLPGLEITRHIVPELEYDASPRADGPRLTAKIADTLTALGWSPDETVLHIHNHSLGKSASLAPAICELAARGYGLLLQIHDFAEDFRPDNYRLLLSAHGPTPAELDAVLYPQAPHVHYAVLNGRDRGVLANLGVPDDCLHDLPNPVVASGTLPAHEEAKQQFAGRFDVDPDRPLLVYPVRGIRRKNLGEMLLLSTMTGQQATLAVTLAPLNPTERASYDAWHRLADELALSCRFDVGSDTGLPYLDNLAAADQLLTTSVAEGFGMVFLETWLNGRSLVGRDLLEITADFTGAGVRFERLYEELRIPLEVIGGRDPLFAALQELYEGLYSAYQFPAAPDNACRASLEPLLTDDAVDFAACPVALQERAIRAAHTSAVVRQQMHDLNPGLRDALTANSESQQPLIEHNANVVRDKYSLARCAERLHALYGKVLASPRAAQVAAPAKPGGVLFSFLNSARMCPVRFE